MTDRETVFFPTDDVATPHLLLDVENADKAEQALQEARKTWDGRLAVTRGYEDSVEGDYLGNVIIGHNEYAIYRM
jgi:hypothetical protein